ncbi:MAG: DNA polymerase/3'-5' exonuclease PolX [Elusimicrobiota bacterium]
MVMGRSNGEIASILEKMAVLCELNGENIFKVRAYEKAAVVVSSFPRPISEIDEKELISIKGIGKNIASHIKEISERGSFSEFDMLLSKYPAGLLELVGVPGLGAKRVKILYEKLNIDSKNKLFEFAKLGKIRQLDGFGEKIEKSIIEWFEKGANTNKRFLYNYAEGVAIGIIKYLKGFGYKKIEYAGSLRRKKETIGDIDIIAVGKSDIAEKFINYPLVEKVLSKGDRKASVMLKNNMQCDLRIVDEDSYGAALCYFTGSKQHNIRLREIANKLGYTLNEYGLFKNYGSKEKIAGKDEQEIYKKLGLFYVPPELREDNGEIELALEGRLPVLVELKDIKGEIHCHTSYTDGTNTIEEIVNFLSKKYSWFFVSDHSSPLNFVHGLDFNEYEKTKKELLNLSKKYKNVSFERSIELEILKNGELAYTEEELRKVDLVIGAVHTSIKMDRQQLTERIIKAIKNPYCDVVAHLSQRLLLERDEINVDYDRIFDIAVKNNTVFEINGQPQRLDLSDINAKRVKSLGLKVVLSSDAHSIDQFDYMEYAVNNARRAGLEKNDILNCLDFKDFKEFIKNNRIMRGGK